MMSPAFGSFRGSRAVTFTGLRNRLCLVELLVLILKLLLLLLLFLRRVVASLTLFHVRPALSGLFRLALLFSTVMLPTGFIEPTPVVPAGVVMPEVALLVVAVAAISLEITLASPLVLPPLTVHSHEIGSKMKAGSPRAIRVLLSARRPSSTAFTRSREPPAASSAHVASGWQSTHVHWKPLRRLGRSNTSSGIGRPVSVEAVWGMSTTLKTYTRPT